MALSYDESMFKKCSVCEQVLPVEMFYRINKNEEKLRARCKKCSNADSASHCDKNRDYLLNYKKSWYRKKLADDPEYRKREYLKNKETILKRAKAYYNNNKEKVRRINDIWKNNNYEMFRASQIKHARKPEVRKMRSCYEHQRRVRLMGNGGSHTLQELEACFNFFSNKCAYCGVEGSFTTIDHVIPISKGGNNNICNIVPACKRCNSSKKDKYLHDWLTDYDNGVIDKINEWVVLNSDNNSRP